MKRHGYLHLLGAKLRLKPGENDTHEAARQWENMFGVKARGPELMFTNSKVEFVKGMDGESEGIIEIIIGVEGRKRLNGIFERAREEGCHVDESHGTVKMIGIRFFFVELAGEAKIML